MHDHPAESTVHLALLCFGRWMAERIRNPNPAVNCWLVPAADRAIRPSHRQDARPIKSS
jgi:hypothetical protein